MSDKIHILIVDDEQQVRTTLRRYLTQEGFRVSEAADSAAMKAVFGKTKIDLVLLDLVLPGEDGLTLARYIRQHSETPIIMLTGKGDLIDRVVGLETGADDYIAKPFHLREVLARIRTVLRRARPSGGTETAAAPAAAKADASALLKFQGWRLDLLRRELVRPSGDAVSLTTGEFELLSVFARNPNRVLNRDQIMELMRGHTWEAYDRAIDTQVVRLRKKIEPDPANPTLIKTVRGAGYIFATTVSRD